ncbi:MAG TPA: response regulator [Stellaceae bacterium]|nr:response regulator [Stellaceae bacterium]
MEPLIAIVDDDKPVRDALQRMLKSHGLAADVFASAEDFVDASGPDRRSCLILDVRLPGMSGLALIDHMAAKGCRIPTILITACPTSAERTRALACGAVSYLAKPFGEQALLATVREALAGAGHAVPGSLPR